MLMPDSPKCLDCLEKGILGQTYKMAGKPMFQCQSCGEIYHRDEFDPEAFLWKDDQAKWSKWYEKSKPKVGEPVKSKKTSAETVSEKSKS